MGSKDGGARGGMSINQRLSFRYEPKKHYLELLSSGLIRKWYGIISILSPVPFPSTLEKDVLCCVLKLMIQWLIGY